MRNWWEILWEFNGKSHEKFYEKLMIYLKRNVMKNWWGVWWEMDEKLKKNMIRNWWEIEREISEKFW